MKNGTMFSILGKYLDKDFLLSHQKIKIYTPNKKHKVILFRNVNDMKPINRFNILRRELLHEEHKINKMFMKFKTQISKNEMANKWISAKNKTYFKK